MSWVDRIQNRLKITTPDEKVYEVLWKNPTKTIEWNASEFAYINVQDQFIDKRLILGRKFPLEFYFVGENHLQEAKFFEVSINDRRPCIIDHPYYDTIIAHIISISFDDTQLNVTKVTGMALETITENNPRTTISPVDAVLLKKIEIDESTEAELNAEIVISDIDTLNQTNAQAYNSGIKIITIPEEAQEYFNLFNTASSYVNTLTATPLLAMRATISLLTMPSKFTASVQDRIKTLLSTFNDLRVTLSGILRLGSKQIYETKGNAVISSMCQAAVTPIKGNYTNSTSALNIIETISAAYDQYLADLDSLQAENGSSPDSFVPGHEAMSQLSEIVGLTLSNLIEIALNGKQERSVILTEDSNIILLTHRFYGLDKNDENIQEFVNNNNLTYKDVLGIGKGRKIVYYV